MVTPLYSLFDIATQPRQSAMFHLHRLPKLRNFRVDDFDSYSSKLGAHLVKDFRVSKPANRDATWGVCRKLDVDIGGDEEEEADLFVDGGEAQGGMGLCIVFEGRVAPDHAKIDGQLGPRTIIAEVVLCLGEEEEPGVWKFAFAFTRGKKVQVVNSLLGFIKTTFLSQAEPCAIAPHHLSNLAHLWTRSLGVKEEEQEEISNLHRAKKLRKLEFLQVHFALPEDNTIQVTIEEQHLIRVHSALREQQQENGGKLIDVLTQYIATHLKIDLMGASVTEIITPTAQLTALGEIRFYWPAHMKRAMFYLREVCKTKTQRVEY